MQTKEMLGTERLPVIKSDAKKKITHRISHFNSTRDLFPENASFALVLKA